MIDLKKAFVCINCEVIFDGDEDSTCPKCTSKHIFKLTRWLPSVTINSPCYYPHVRIKSSAVEEMKEALEKAGDFRPMGVCFSKDLT